MHLIFHWQHFGNYLFTPLFCQTIPDIWFSPLSTTDNPTEYFSWDWLLSNQLHFRVTFCSIATSLRKTFDSELTRLLRATEYLQIYFLNWLQILSQSRAERNRRCPTERRDEAELNRCGFPDWDLLRSKLKFRRLKRCRHRPHREVECSRKSFWHWHRPEKNMIM